MATDISGHGRIRRATHWFNQARADGRRVQARNKNLSIVDVDAANRMHRIPIVYSDNRIIISDDAAHTGYRIPMRSWAFDKHKDRKQAWQNAATFFSRVFPSEPNNAGHLIVTNRVFSAAAWHHNIIEKAKNAQINDAATKTLTAYLTASKKARLDGHYGDEFFERNVYLFTKVGSRSEGKLTDLLLKVLHDLIAMAAFDKEPPEPGEIAAWVEKSEGISSSLQNSWAKAQPISQWEVEWLIRHLDTPSLPTPSLAFNLDDDFTNPMWVQHARAAQLQRGLDPDRPEQGAPAGPNARPIHGEAAVEAWGFGQWRTVMASYTSVVSLGRGANKEDLHAVQFDAPTVDDEGNHTSYACYLPLNHIPAHILYNVNWLNESSKLGFPVDASVHFQVLDQAATEKELDKKIRSAENQALEDQEAGVSSDQTNRENHASLEAVKTRTKQNKQPLVHWQCVLSVSDTDPDRLRDRVNALINHYKQTLQMELVCPGDDQRELFYQSLPGSEVIIDDWFHPTDPEYLASAAPWLTDTIGDNKGMYQGYTITESGSRGMPFFYDNFTVVDNVGKAPTEAVAAEPGWGKTVSRGLKVVFEEALQGDVTGFVYDPKGDFRVLYDERRRLGLQNRVSLIDLGDPNISVSLDAFGLAEVGDDENGDPIDQRSTLARRVLRQLLSFGAAEDSQLVRVAEIAVARVLRGEQHGEGVASMRQVRATLRRWAKNEFDSLDTMSEGDDLPLVRNEMKDRQWMVDASAEAFRKLNDMSKDKLGRLLFKPFDNDSGVMKVVSGSLTIFVAMQLKLLEEGEVEQEEHRISTVISSLMTDYIRTLLSAPSIRLSKKAATFDEWHAIKRVNGAEGLMNWMRRMGRSRRCFVRQMSQSAGDFDVNSLTTVWCGHVDSVEEAKLSCKLLGIEQSENNIRLLMNLGKGQFLFRDHLGRVARVEVDFWDPDLLDMFNTQAADQEARELQKQGTRSDT